MTAARVLRPSGNAEVAPGKPPLMSARYLYACMFGLMGTQILRIVLT